MLKAEMSKITWYWSQMGDLAQPRERLWTRLKDRHHQVGFLLAVCLGVKHAEPLGPEEKASLAQAAAQWKAVNVESMSHKWLCNITSYPSCTRATMPSTFRLPCKSTQKFGLLPAIWLAEGSSSSSSEAPAPTSSTSEVKAQTCQVTFVTNQCFLNDCYILGDNVIIVFFWSFVYHIKWN